MSTGMNTVDEESPVDHPDCIAVEEAIRNAEAIQTTPERYTAYPCEFERELLVSAERKWEDPAPLKQAHFYARALEAHINEIHASLRRVNCYFPPAPDVSRYEVQSFLHNNQTTKSYCYDMQSLLLLNARKQAAVEKANTILEKFFDSEKERSRYRDTPKPHNE